MKTLVSISAEINSQSRLLDKSLEDAEDIIEASLVKLEREDSEGEFQTVPQGEIGSLLEGDRIYLILEVDDIGKVEKSLGS